MNEEQFNVRAEIMDAISKTDDAKDRSMLMLMLAILERVEKLLDDEAGLQSKVLNGLTVRHKTDHEWIEQQRSLDCAAVCEWSKKKMDAEILASREAEITRKHVWKRVVGRAAEHAVTIVLTLAAVWLGLPK